MAKTKPHPRFPGRSEGGEFITNDSTGGQAFTAVIAAIEATLNALTSDLPEVREAFVSTAWEHLALARDAAALMDAGKRPATDDETEQEGDEG